MDSESLQARIEHERAELHAVYPHIKDCRAALVRWSDPEGIHYSQRLDIRWPQHQTLISGEAKADALAAIDAGFHAARERVREASWASRQGERPAGHDAGIMSDPRRCSARINAGQIRGRSADLSWSYQRTLK